MAYRESNDHLTDDVKAKYLENC